MVSSRLAKGRWNRAIGLKKWVMGQLLPAINSPINELIPSWADVFCSTFRFPLITLVVISSKDMMRSKHAMAGTRLIATGQFGWDSDVYGQCPHCSKSNFVQNGVLSRGGLINSTVSALNVSSNRSRPVSGSVNS